MDPIAKIGQIAGAIFCILLFGTVLSFFAILCFKAIVWIAS